MFSSTVLNFFHSAGSPGVHEMHPYHGFSFKFFFFFRFYSIALFKSLISQYPGCLGLITENLFSPYLVTTTAISRNLFAALETVMLFSLGGPYCLQYTL